MSDVAFKTPTEPSALAYYLSDNPATPQIVELLKRCGVESQGFSDPKTFLLNLDKLNPNVSFLYLKGTEVKVVIAIIKSIRKVLGDTIPIYVIMSAEEQELETSILHAGATATLLQPIDLKTVAPILRKYVVTAELAELLAQEKAASGPPVIKSDSPLPPIIDWVFEKIFPVMASLSTVLENLDEIETRTRFYEDKLKPFKDQFIGMVNSLRKSDDGQKMALTQCLRLYGLNNARTLIVADKLLESMRGQGLRWNDKTGRMEEDPKKVIPFANAIREHFGEDSLYRELAFNSGLVFDIFNQFAEAIPDRKATLKKEIDAARKRASERAQKGLEEAKSTKDLPLAKHIVTTMLMTEAGRMGMAIFYKDYLDFQKSVEKAKLRPGLQHIAEKEKYGITHNLLGAVICQITPSLSPAYAAVLFKYYPFMLSKGDEKDLYSLAEITQRL